MAHLCGARLCQDNLFYRKSESVAKVKVKVKFHMASVKGKSHVVCLDLPPKRPLRTYMYTYRYIVRYDGTGNRIDRCDRELINLLI